VNGCFGTADRLFIAPASSKGFGVVWVFADVVLRRILTLLPME
jgi:hypothetical protein